MTAALAHMFDGERHLFDLADGYFPETGATLVIDGWEEDEEEDVLSPFESATLIPVLRETRTIKDDPRFPLSRLQQAWGGLSIQLTALCYIIGVQKKQYEEVNHKEDTRNWSFQMDEFVTERL